MTDSGSPGAPPASVGEGRRGLFLVVEGVEGAGKTTQVDRIVRWLDLLGAPVVRAREPGGTPVGEAVREVLLDRAGLRIGAESELLLMLAARAAFVRDVVRPALDRGAVMVADRFEQSTFAYQGYGRGLPLEEIRRLNTFATGGLRPDLVLALDVAAAEGRRRQRRSGKVEDRIESAGDGFLDRVAAGYRALAREDERVVLIDARPAADRVESSIRRTVQERFPELRAFEGGSNEADLPPPNSEHA